MSIASQELLRKMASGFDFSELSQEEEIPGEGFQKLMRVESIREKSDDREFFSLFEKEEEEISPKDADPSAAQHPLSHPLSLPVAVEKKKEKERPSYTLSPIVPLPSCPISCASLLTGAPFAITETGKSSALPPVIAAAFEAMVSTMLIMDSCAEVETIFFLDSPHFASSVLFGTKITIREFSTAPKMFNIEITSNPQGVALMEAGKSHLFAAFENAHLNFTVHRFETHLLQSEKGPVFQRKETSDQDLQDHQGGRRQ
jgi:hypothetical protein